ncbi:MAG TPA: hypothetical protein VHG51_00460 [Longimicrobiaceae bacterium]|nr:hypothetical protein [Longimicrobiaceae bacterium]
MKRHLNKRVQNAELYVDCDARPGWVSAHDRLPGVGEEVYCAVGVGEVSAVLGKTGDGSRLLEIRLPTAGAKPYFAAASNVLVVAVPGVAPEAPYRPALDGSDAGAGAAAVWLT